MKLKTILIGLGIVSFLVILDQVTKSIVMSNMQLNQSIGLIDGFFSLTFVRNDGAGFSMLGGRSAILITISSVSTLLFMYLFRYADFQKKRLYSISVSLILGGTIGNLIDRAIYQKVTDFLDFIIFGYDFPVFNVADICLTVGIFLFAIVFFKDEKKIKEKNDDKGNNQLNSQE